MLEDDNGRTVYTRYYLPIVKVNDYNIMIDRINFFDQPAKCKIITQENITKVPISQGDD